MNEDAKGPDHFIVSRLLGEDDDSTVVLATEIESGKEFAIKILEKMKLQDLNKLRQIEKERSMIGQLRHPFFVNLHWTFEDEKRIYFVLSYAKHGEFLTFIEANTYLSNDCAKFYAAQLVLALEYLFAMKIIHRDLKPENILLNDKMHIQVTDFGTATQIQENDSDQEGRTMSFVGSAEYVPPELLTDKTSCYSSDLWSLGCIIYQMLTGKTPFHDTNEFQVFQNIINRDLEFPENLDGDAKDLINQLLVIDPNQRLGCEEQGGFEKLKNHKFFHGISWNTLTEQPAPALRSLYPSLSCESQGKVSPGGTSTRSSHSAMLDKKVVRLQCSDPGDTDGYGLSLHLSDEERVRRMSQQRDTTWNHFSQTVLIVKQGYLEKKRGLSVKVRYFLLTEAPRIVYIDSDSMEVKGEIPVTSELKTEVKTFKVFYIHVPGRTYHLIDKTSNAIKWCRKIEEGSPPSPSQRAVRVDVSNRPASNQRDLCSLVLSIDNELDLTSHRS